jgi:hypothetical protein
MGDITVRVNGTLHSLDVDSRMSVPGLLRERRARQHRLTSPGWARVAPGTGEPAEESSQIT